MKPHLEDPGEGGRENACLRHWCSPTLPLSVHRTPSNFREPVGDEWDELRGTS